MKNPTVKELLEKLSAGEISKDEFDLFLQKLKEDKESSELNQAFLEFFEGKGPQEKE